ncbi:hypothetical protein SAMN04487936_1178 [Halobacillus dabanensis]|uniref:Membrane domain of glycerophosphoryl diester phosphodiesterase n=1 Tax=Halobacillus dabanensis TaxID=240302 RepID=A0A1I4ACJ5_HALDA|nr:hypothetical protein [Halobacillus dabanensis]SFK54054.1 hypothetical protein SAMN04487936_1178 [Halobacillus dabanensis]
MEQPQTKPRSFGEILDYTFSISKKNFGPLFLVLLILSLPIYIIDYLFMVLSGVSIFRDSLEGGFTEGFINNLDSAATTQEIVANNLGLGMEVIYLVLSTVLAFILYPMAQASIIIATSKVMKQESWKKSQVMKGAFSRFFPLVGSTALMGVIFGVVFFLGFLLLGMMGGVSFARDGFGPGLIITIILALAFLGVLAYFAVKLSMFFGSVVFQKVAPGFSKSWKLTKGRFWATLGLFIVFMIIAFLLTSVMEGVSVLLLGGSVLGRIFTDIASIITTLFLMVGYTVLFFDLKTRNEADDLKDMIASYKES